MKDQYLFEVLQKCDEKINGIELLMTGDKGKYTRAILYIQYESLRLVPIAMFEDSMRKTLVNASQVIQFKDGIIPINEIEIGIHTKLIPTFLIG